MANLYDKPKDLNFINTYTSPNMDAMLKAATAIQGRSDLAEEGRGAIEDTLMDVNALPFGGDEEKRDALVQGYEDRISKEYERVGGDYSKMLPFVKNLHRDVQKDLKRGQAAQLNANYQKWNEWAAAEQDRAKKNEINDEAFKSLYAQKMQNYIDQGGVGTAGDLQTINTVDMIDQYDLGEEMNKFVKSMEGTTRTDLGSWMKSNGLGHGEVFEKITTQSTQLTPEEIELVGREYIKRNPVYQPYLNQVADAKVFAHKKQTGMSLLQERIATGQNLSPEEVKEMQQAGFETSEKGIEDYLTAKAHEEYKWENVDELAKVVGVANKIDKVTKTDERYTDQMTLHSLKDQYDKTNQAQTSGLLGTVKTFDLKTILKGITDQGNNATQAFDNTKQQILELGLGNNDFIDFTNKSGAVAVQDFIGQMTTNRDGVIAQIMQENGWNTNDMNNWTKAEQLADDALESAQQYKVFKTKENEHKAVRKNASDRAIQDISDYDWNTNYKQYQEEGGTLSLDEYKEGLSSASTEEEFNTMFGEAAWMGEMGDAGQGVMGTLIPGYSKIVSSKTGPSTTAKNMWNKVQDKTKETISAGAERHYTKRDYSEIEGTSQSMLSAEKSLSQGNTRIKVNGQDLTMNDVFGPGYTKLNISGLQDFGTPTFMVEAKNTDGDMVSQVVTLPGFEGLVHDENVQLLNSSNKETRMAAEMYLGAEIMGDHWHANAITIMSPGIENSIPLSLHDGTTFGEVVKEKNGDLTIFVNGDRQPVQAKSADEVAREVFKITQKAAKQLNN
jgi:hypothetical protein